MTQEQFIYWLQGFMELSSEPLTKREQMIKDHLKTIFHKVTPNYEPLTTPPNYDPQRFNPPPLYNPNQVIC